MATSNHIRGTAPLRLVGLLLAALLASACSRQEQSSNFLARVPSPADLPIVYRVDIQQGSVITQDMLAQLEKGMERDKVRFIMGTPPIEDVFHPDRWDYLYSYKQRSGRREQRRVTLHFVDDKLAYLTGDIKPAAGLLQPQLRHDKVVDVPNNSKRDGLLKNMAAKLGLGDDGPKYLDREPGAEIGLAADQPAQSADDAGAQPESGAIDESKEAAAQTSEQQASVEPPATKHEEQKGLFGRMIDRIGLGNKDRDEELIHRDPSADNPLDN